MKRKITGAILISLGLGLFWQALAQGLDCKPYAGKDMSNVVTRLTSLSIQSAA